MGDWTCTIQAWTDPFAAWREELERKIAFGEPDLTSELQEGALMLREAGERAKGDDATVIEHALRTLEDAKAPGQRQVRRRARHRARSPPSRPPPSATSARRWSRR